MSVHGVPALVKEFNDDFGKDQNAANNFPISLKACIWINFECTKNELTKTLADFFCSYFGRLTTCVLFRSSLIS